ncbi:MAG: adenylyltransferase/cytidyltransferase family protein [Phycisphaerales bacterium]|nr:adenylyltransferase/cytidyltransferase family protein [Phycisphaerales bacterium]
MLHKQAVSDDPAPDYRRKIVTPDQLREIVATLRESNPEAKLKVVQCHGCFDIVHPGHIRYLQFARSQGDLLVASITGDALIDKDSHRPYIPQELRAENLAALELVDYVIIDPHPTACALLKIIRPDIYVKGHEYATSNDPRFLSEREVVESYGGRVIFSSGQVVFSSSRLAEAMSPSGVSFSAGNECSEMGDLPAQRLSLLCKRHNVDQQVLSDLLNKMSGRRVLILGDVVVDRYVLCDANNMAGESPMMSLKQLYEKDYLNGAAMIATQVAALGAKPILITTLGQDRLSKWTLGVLSQAGVCVQKIHHRPHARIQVEERASDDAGIHAFETASLPIRTRFLVDDQKLFRIEHANLHTLDSVGEREVAALVKAQVVQADAVIICDGGYGLITPGLLRQVEPLLRKRGPFIATEPPECQSNLAALRNLDLLCCSEQKLRRAMNDFNDGLSSLAYRMLELTQAGRMLVTLGKRGLVTFSRPSNDRASDEWRGRLLSEHLPPVSDRIIDRLGFDEALLTAATLASAVGANLMQAAYLGSLLAATQATRPGPVPISDVDIRKCIQHRPELHSIKRAPHGQRSGKQKQLEIPV